MSKIPVVGIVACLFPEMGIGFQGTLPWRLSKEMKYFKQVTTMTKDPTKRNAVVMGRKTWESIPARFRPLPGRINLIVSREAPTTFAKDESHSDCYHSNSLLLGVEALKQLDSSIERIYIIGGGQIYDQSYGITDHWLITKIQPDQSVTPVPQMDTFLHKFHLENHFKEQGIETLKNFLPSEVELPATESTVSGYQTPKYIFQEKGYTFWPTIYDSI